jgi:hypothetical protein
MKLNEIQIEVLNDNLSKAHQLAELMYQASIESIKQNVSISDWCDELGRLSIRLDDMRDVFHCFKVNR